MIYNDVKQLAENAALGNHSSTAEMKWLKANASPDAQKAYNVLTGIQGGGELRRGVDLSIWRDYHLADRHDEVVQPGVFAPWLSSEEAANIQSGIQAVYQLSAENLIYAGHELCKLWRNVRVDENDLVAYAKATDPRRLLLWKYINQFGAFDLDQSIKSINETGLVSRYEIDKIPDSRFRYELVGQDASPTTALDILVKRDVCFNFFFMETEELAKTLAEHHTKTYGPAKFKFAPAKTELFQYGCVELHDLVTPELHDDKKGSRLPGRTSSTVFGREIRNQVKDPATALSVSAKVATIAGDLGHQTMYGKTRKEWFAREDILFGPHILKGIEIKAWLELARLLNYSPGDGKALLEKSLSKEEDRVMGMLFRIQALIPGKIKLGLGTRE